MTHLQRRDDRNGCLRRTLSLSLSQVYIYIYILTSMVLMGNGPIMAISIALEAIESLTDGEQHKLRTCIHFVFDFDVFFTFEENHLPTVYYTS